MPGRDGTGPMGQGPVMGRGGARQGNRAGAGPSGYCVCPKCGERLIHNAGLPCTATKCPKCGAQMVRGS
jgi:predicted RNA-binding Zn-ribbon protein involved in translation (DUF1610 family)